MFNPAILFKFKGMKDKFVQNHPKFVPFLQAIQKAGIAEGMVIEFKVTTADGQVINSNIQVQEGDVELFNEISQLLGDM